MKHRRQAVGTLCVLLVFAAAFVSLRTPLKRGMTLKGAVLSPVVRLVGHQTVVSRLKADCRECHGDPGRVAHNP